MFAFFKSARPARPGHTLRVSLRLEPLGDRAVPGSLDGGTTPTDPSATDPTLIAPAPSQTAPVIDSFTAQEMDYGWYQFMGHVTDDRPTAGLIVTFGGVPSLEGKTAVVSDAGTFSLLVQVKTDGSDSGTVTAQTVDTDGNPSNVAMCYISPTT